MQLTATGKRKRRGISTPSFPFAIILLLLLFSAISMPAEDRPSRGGTLRLALINDPATLDPGFVSSQFDFVLLPLLYQPLVDLRSGANVVNNLVTNWTVSPDQRVFTFHLLPGVRFSNGREASAEDHRFTLERFVTAPAYWQQYALQIKGAPEFLAARTNEASQLLKHKAAGGGRWIEPTRLAGVSAPSRYTLVVELEKPDATFKYLLAQVFGMAVARETLSDPLKDAGRRPVGTGPYRVKEWVRGARLRYERNPCYFRPEQQYFDEIDIMIGGDETTHLMMFERGQLDLASLGPGGAPEADFPRLRQDPRWKTGWDEAQMYQAIILNLNTEMPPLDDARVRQAIAHAIDRERFQRMNGERVAPGHGGITPLMAGFDPDLKYLHYDPERARALLREAGYPNGLPKPLQFWHGNLQTTRRWALAIQEDLKQAGIPVELHDVSTAAFVDTMTQRHRAEMCLYRSTANNPDASANLSLYHSRFITEEGSQNAAFYHDATVDQLLDQAAVSVNEPERLALYRRVDQILVSNGSLIVLGHENLFALHQPWLHGPLLEPMYWFRLDRVWFEKPMEQK
jgi:ABC-type transport system substrate-binding protein